LAVCSAVSLFLLFFPEPVLRIFSSDPALLEMGPHAIRLMVAGFFLSGFNKVGGAVFQALGKARPAFIVNMARPILFFIPLLLLLPKVLGLDGVWFSFAAADVLSFILTFLLLLPETRNLKSLEASTEGA
jgi:Na+-driven multidrug efflux pump